MNSILNSPLDKAPSNNTLLDLLVSALAGMAMSVTMSLLFFFSWGWEFSAPHLLDILRLYFGPTSERETWFRLVAAVPVVTPILAIFVTRSWVQAAAHRLRWIAVAALVAFTSTIVVVISASLVAQQLGYTESLGSEILGFLPFGFFYGFCGFVIGALLGVIFSPKRRVFKILIAAIASAIVGGMYEMIAIYAISTS